MSPDGVDPPDVAVRVPDDVDRELDPPGGAAGDVAAEVVRVTAWVSGRVQGVGFRWWTRARARELGLAGSASNLDDGRVEVVAEGHRRECEALLDQLRTGGSPGRVTLVVERWSVPLGVTGFMER